MAPHGYQCRVVTQEQLTASFFIPQEMFPNIAKNTSITLWCQIEDTAKKNNISIYSRATKFVPQLIMAFPPNFRQPRINQWLIKPPKSVC